MLAGARLPTEKAPLESVLYCWVICVSHAAESQGKACENLEPQKRRTWTGLVMAPSTTELYTPRREYNGPNCALSCFVKKSGNFAEKYGNFAGKSGIGLDSGILTNYEFLLGIGTLQVEAAVYFDVPCL